MGGQVAFAFIDPSDSKRVDYYFMGDYSLGEIETYLHESYKVMKDCGTTLFEGNCTLDEYNSKKFQEDHDLVGACIILPDCIVLHKQHTIVTYRRRKD
jgi:hypothetical protein